MIFFHLSPSPLVFHCGVSLWETQTDPNNNSMPQWNICKRMKVKGSQISAYKVFILVFALRFSQDAVLLQWHPSAVMFPSFPVAVWVNAGWCLAGGWDGSSSMTGMIYLERRYFLFIFLQLTHDLTWWGKRWLIVSILKPKHTMIYNNLHVTFTRLTVLRSDSTGSGKTQPAYSGSLQHRSGGAGANPQQHSSKLLQQHHQLP